MHMSPILARYGGGTMSTPEEEIRVVQEKLRRGGFDVALTGELDECTCAALKAVGGPADLIQECGELGGNCGNSRQAKQRSAPRLADAQPARQFSPQVTQAASLLLISALGVAGLWALQRKQEKAKHMHGYESIASAKDIQDLPFTEIEGEKVEYKYLTSGDSAAQPAEEGES